MGIGAVRALRLSLAAASTSSSVSFVVGLVYTLSTPASMNSFWSAENSQHAALQQLGYVDSPCTIAFPVNPTTKSRLLARRKYFATFVPNNLGI